MAKTLTDQLGLKQDPAPLQLLGEAGFLWSYLGRWDEARTVFEALIVLAPKDPAGYLGLAELYLSQNEHAEGHKQAEKAVKAAVGRADANEVDRSVAARAYLIAGQCLVQIGNVAKAQQAFSKAVDLEPNGPSGARASEMLEAGKKIGLLQQ